MDEELAARLGGSRRILVIEPGAQPLADELRARGCDVTVADDPAEARESEPFDVAVVMQFRDDGAPAGALVRSLHAALATGGRILVSPAGAGAAAVRSTVYGESAGEVRAPLVRDVDLDRFASRALEELLATSGFRVAPGTPGDGWIEGTATLAQEPSRESPPIAGPEPSAAALAEQLRGLREFVDTVLRQQRRLHEELARARAAIASRDESLAALRLALGEASEATALAKERLLHVRALEARLAESDARIADLEARRIRLTEAVVELRER